jgi:hypothetical protein
MGGSIFDVCGDNSGPSKHVVAGGAQLLTVAHADTGAALAAAILIADHERPHHWSYKYMPGSSAAGRVRPAQTLDRTQQNGSCISQ